MEAIQFGNIVLILTIKIIESLNICVLKYKPHFSLLGLIDIKLLCHVTIEVSKCLVSFWLPSLAGLLCLTQCFEYHHSLCCLSGQYFKFLKEESAWLSLGQRSMGIDRLTPWKRMGSPWEEIFFFSLVKETVTFKMWQIVSSWPNYSSQLNSLLN